MIAQSFQNFQAMNEIPDSIKTGKKGFSEAAGGIANSFDSVLEKIIAKAKSVESPTAIKINNFNKKNPLNVEDKDSLIGKLLGNLKLGDMAPEDMVVDAKGIKLLEQLLGSMGFGEEEISSFISDLTADGTKNKLSLSSLLAKTKTFLESMDSHDELAMSALPFVESILAGMGVDPKKIEKLLYNSGTEDGGLDLQNLISGLKGIASAGEANKTVAGAGEANKTVVGAGEANKTVGELEMSVANRQLLSGLGISGMEEKTLSLNDFISKLEALVDVKNGKNISNGQADQIAKSFGESLHPAETDKVKNGNKFVLNNHSFQKQQQMAEEAFNSEGQREKTIAQGKTGESAFIVKESAVLSDKKNMPAGFTKTPDDTNGQTPKMGITTDSMTGKMENSGLKLAVEKPLPSYVTNQVGRQIAYAVKNGESAIKFQIKPPEMGRLQISLEFTKTGLKVGILAEHTATRDMLLSNSGELKSILGDQGIRLDKVQVDVSGNFDQSMADARKESNNSGGKQSGQDNNERSYDQVAGNEIISLHNEISGRVEEGRLDLVV